jgi:hypothetical protein
MCREPGLRCLPERVGLNDVLGRTLGRLNSAPAVPPATGLPASCLNHAPKPTRQMSLPRPMRRGSTN